MYNYCNKVSLTPLTSEFGLIKTEVVEFGTDSWTSTLCCRTNIITTSCHSLNPNLEKRAEKKPTLQCVHESSLN